MQEDITTIFDGNLIDFIVVHQILSQLLILKMIKIIGAKLV